jgi:hypothetical protein
MKKKITTAAGLYVTVIYCMSSRVFAQSPGLIINPGCTPKAVQEISREGFVHPGILLSAADLNRIQKMVREGYGPWAGAFEQFRKATKALKTYKILNLAADGKGRFPVMSEGYGHYDARRDADAAFAQTIMWYITGDADPRTNEIPERKSHGGGKRADQHRRQKDTAMGENLQPWTCVLIRQD